MKWAITYSMFPLPVCPNCDKAMVGGDVYDGRPAWECDCGYRLFADGAEWTEEDDTALDPYREFMEALD